MANWKFDVRGISLDLKPVHVLWKTSPVTKSVSRSCVSCVANGCSHWQFYHHLLHLDSFPCHNSCPQHSAILHLTYALLKVNPTLTLLLFFLCSSCVSPKDLVSGMFLTCSSWILNPQRVSEVVECHPRMRSNFVDDKMRSCCTFELCRPETKSHLTRRRSNAWRAVWSSTPELAISSAVPHWTTQS